MTILNAITGVTQLPWPSDTFSVNTRHTAKLGKQ